MEPFHTNNGTLFMIEQWMERFPGLVAGFSSKNGGVSKPPFMSLNTGYHVGDDPNDVKRNREIIASMIGFPLDAWVGAEQTHGANIVNASRFHMGKGAGEYSTSVKDTDGFYTNEPGLLLTLCFADCVPVYFLAPETGKIGIAHAGWKGTVEGIGPQMVKGWKAEGIPLSKIYAVIGPSICEKCYIVDDYVLSFVKKRLEHVEKKPYNQISEGQYSLDLKEMNRLLLIECGIPGENIEISNYCSSCESETFYSHRRDRGKTGRMMGFIGWRKGAERGSN
ncbi:laccase [Bacillus sp. FJAT-27225]|uniref:peptidoglycan editing factor PgeF n=1 Tax=Bacillus sp. FJAT-27225 TaxID=1743144 RepID=UPI00080C20DD|nr:peptidoglycan editing factor PgeF [Bacillus sp. FJAT-27225]OCA85524.1 laccase [Bacillus sp. FJAT-27225]